MISKTHKLVILLFLVLLGVSIFMTYKRYMVDKDFEVFYSDTGIPEILEE